MREWDCMFNSGASSKQSSKLDYSDRNGEGSLNGGGQNQEVHLDAVCMLLLKTSACVSRVLTVVGVLSGDEAELHEG